jgi:hypothetical protein
VAEIGEVFTETGRLPEREVIKIFYSVWHSNLIINTFPWNYIYTFVTS